MGKSQPAEGVTAMLGKSIMNQNYLEKYNDYGKEWVALFKEGSNLVRKLHDDEDGDFDDWHKMTLIYTDLKWLIDLINYEHALNFIEQNVSDDEKFEVAKVHYRVTELGKASIDAILNDCKYFTIHAGYAGYFTEKVRRFVEDVKDSFFSDSEESED